MIDFSTALGRRVGQELESEHVIWLTTVGRNKTPQPRPVWFIWDGTSFLIYSQRKAHKIGQIAGCPRVSLNLNTDSEGHEVAVLTGEARVDPSTPPADKHSEYLEKYTKGIADLGMTPREFALDYSVAIRVTPTGLRGF